MSLLLDKKFPRGPGGSEKEIQCKICLYDCPQTLMVKLEDCGCAFCREVILSHGWEGGMGIIFLCFQCLRQYITFEVMEGAYDISCPDPHCPTQVSNTPHSLGNSVIT